MNMETLAPEMIKLPSGPRLWPYALTLLILVPIWIFLLEAWIRPKALMPEFVTPAKRLGMYALPPLILVASVFCLSAIVSASLKDAQLTRMAEAEAQAERARKEALEASIAGEKKHKYTLEVLGLGLAVDRFRQTHVWDETQNKQGKYILPEDPKAYPWSEIEKWEVSCKRSADVFEHAGSWFVEKWHIPAFAVRAQTLRKNLDDWQLGGDLGERQGAGMHWHRFRLVGVVYADYPEAVSEALFTFFDAHPEVPAALLFVEDGEAVRSLLASSEKPHPLKDGYRQPGEMTDAMAAFMVARRDRVEAVRPYAMLADQQAYATMPFWEKEQIKSPFPATEYMPKPWNKEQLEQFDKLPVIGRLHRPQVASFVVDDKALGEKARNQAFLEAWKQALTTLPEGQAPGLVIFDCGAGKNGRMAPLCQALDQLGPELSVPGKHSVDLSQALGDTGASSFFMGLGLGTIASHRSGLPTAVVSFRDPARATIQMITPPSTEERKKRHPAGGDPLNYGVVPYTK